MAYQTGDVSLQAQVKIRIEREWKGEKLRKIIDTTVGRVIFNNAIPQDLGFVDRGTEENLFKLEVDQLVVKKDIGNISRILIDRKIVIRVSFRVVAMVVKQQIAIACPAARPMWFSATDHGLAGHRTLALAETHLRT